MRHFQPDSQWSQLAPNVAPTCAPSFRTMRALDSLKFKQEAGWLVTGGQSLAAAFKSLGVVELGHFSSGSKLTDKASSNALTARFSALSRSNMALSTSRFA